MPEPPRLKDRFVCLRLLGKGGQARVFLAWDTRLSQWRAIKMLDPKVAADPELHVRFDREARTMARLKHRNVVPVLDVEQHGDLPFLVMELARGGSVAEWLRRNGAMPPRMAVRIARQVAQGLAHAHALGVVHRDVKPHNLLVRDDGTVVLTDFGVAQDDAARRITVTGTVLGTVVFMAPEQRRDSKDVDLRADVYALGATLYALLTNRKPPDLFSERPEAFEGVPEALQPVVRCACRYDPQDRYPSMEAFEDALEVVRLPPDPPHAPFPDRLLELPANAAEVEDDPGLEVLRLAEAPAPSIEPTVDIALDTAELQASEDARRAREEPSSPAPGLLRPLLLLVPVSVLVVLIGVAFSATRDVSDASERLRAARQQLVARMEDERNTLELVASLGADRANLESLYAAWLDARGEPARSEAAVRYVQALEADLVRHGAAGLPSAEAARASLARLEDAVDTHEAARAEVEGFGCVTAP